MTRPSRSRFIELPGGRHHLREWGDPEAPLLLMLHGWMDVSGTFQFLVEALRERWHVVAPDWLGHGLSGWRSRPYWFAEAMLDLDALVDRLSPRQPLRILGHSMGGNLASLWAGVRPQRLERLVMLEAFGHPRMTEAMARDLQARFLNDAREGPCHPVHADRQAFIARLRQANPRLSAERAERIATWLARELDDGRVVVNVDPWHRSVLSHVVHQDVQMLSAWRAVTAPVLWITGVESETLRFVTDTHGGEPAMLERMAHFGDLRHERIPDAGHNVQHDQPEALARTIEPFFAGARPVGPGR